MHILFRCDASVALGTGHVFRCLALAEELRLQGASVTFVCGTDAGNLNDWLVGRGYAVMPAASVDDLGWIESLDIRPDWLVVDHYGLNATWEELVKPHVNQ